MDEIERLSELISNLWKTDVEKVYLTGKICNEYHFSAEVYHILKQKLEGYDLWVCPGLPKETEGITHTIFPDIIISKDNVVLAFIELKYKSGQEASEEKDLEHLGRYAKIFEDNSIHFEINPKTGNTIKDDSTKLSVSSNVLNIFAVVCLDRNHSNALDPERFRVDPPKKLLHLTGNINANHKPIFDAKILPVILEQK